MNQRGFTTITSIILAIVAGILALGIGAGVRHFITKQFTITHIAISKQEEVAQPTTPQIIDRIPSTAQRLIYYKDGVVYKSDPEGKKISEVVRLELMGKPGHETFFDLARNGILLIRNFESFESPRDLWLAHPELKEPKTLEEQQKIFAVKLQETLQLFDPTTHEIKIIPPLSEITLGQQVPPRYFLSPDGSKILGIKYNSYPEQDERIGIYDVVGKRWKIFNNPQKVVGFEESSVRSPWSPDSKKIYLMNHFISSGPAIFQPDTTVYSMDVTSGETQGLAQVGNFCAQGTRKAVPARFDDTVIILSCMLTDSNMRIRLFNRITKGVVDVMDAPIFGDNQISGIESLPSMFSDDNKKFIYVQGSGITHLLNIVSKEDHVLPNEIRPLFGGSPEGVFSFNGEFVYYLTEKDCKGDCVEKEGTLKTFDVDTNIGYAITTFKERDNNPGISVIGWSR